jgi:peptidoglycan DL-endopeptidase CwlO
VASTTVMTLIAGACMAAPPSHNRPSQPTVSAAASPPSRTGLTDPADPADPAEESRQLRLQAARVARADRVARAARADHAARTSHAARDEPIAASPPARPPERRLTTGGPAVSRPTAARPAPRSTARKPKASKARKAAAGAPRSVPDRAGAAGAVVAFALAQVGKPYRHAGEGPNAFDCSGLAKAAYARVGVSLPHQTGGVAGRGRPVSRSDLRPGDLVFTDPGHVGIYIGGDEMVHASTPRGGVKRSPVYRFAFARRVIG